MRRYWITQSNGISLRLTEQEYKEYERKLLDLQLSYYHKEVMELGFYASNQDCYVSDPTEFNSWDGKRTAQEYIFWLGERRGKL